MCEWFIWFKGSATPIADDGTKSEAPLTGDQEPTTSLPRWYNANQVSDFEQRILPEWFNQSAVYRTSSSYLSTRERIIHVARESGNKICGLCCADNPEEEFGWSTSKGWVRETCDSENDI